MLHIVCIRFLISTAQHCVKLLPFCGALFARRDFQRFMALDMAAVNGWQALLSPR